MKILNYGSLNIDKVYDVEHFVNAKETIMANGYGEFLGGKGLNQSVALARAGALVYHLGAAGTDGEIFFECLQECGVDTTYLHRLETVSGHAIIQNAGGQNCIIVCSGANGEVTEEQIAKAICQFKEGDVLLLQNEVANVPFAMECAKKQGMKIAFNASPITKELFEYPLQLVDYFLINEVEAKALAGTESEEYPEILRAVREKYPQAAIVMTVGEDGVFYADAENVAEHGAYKVKVVDTTATGDTFCGYFLASLAKGYSTEESLHFASMASAISVGRKGASNSIPLWDEVQEKI